MPKQGVRMDVQNGTGHLVARRQTNLHNSTLREADHHMNTRLASFFSCFRERFMTWKYN